MVITAAWSCLSQAAWHHWDRDIDANNDISQVVAGEKEKYTVYKLKLSAPGSVSKQKKRKQMKPHLVRSFVWITDNKVAIEQLTGCKPLGSRWLYLCWSFSSLMSQYWCRFTGMMSIHQVPSSWFLHRRYSDFLTMRATLIKVVIVIIIVAILIIIVI